MQDSKSSLQQHLKLTFGRENLSKAAVVLAVVLLAYFIPNKFMLFEPHHAPVMFADHWIPLMPAWIWVYVSYYLFLVGAFIFATGHPTLRVFVNSMVVSAAICSVIFVFFPTIVVRDLYPWLGRSNIHTNMLDWIRAVDHPVNCMPSMHVCMSYIAASTFSITTRRLWIRSLIWIWFLAICFSTMATKQHYFIDVVTGFLIGFTVFSLMMKRYMVVRRQNRSV